ncbi:MAG: uracil-DNA glycosylase [Planctomycetes bacterium]|nr:uracil-DNA glycosylase [Planctomycetota bacterium]
MLAREVQSCRACRLCEKRKLAVPGEGPADARVAFVGEGPGYDEDRSGRPFVGAAGQLLTAIIERGMGLERSRVWIGNTVKCRPPGNRNPEPDEIQACEPFLRRQLDIVRPAVIVTLGRFATQLLTGRSEGILELRGQVYAVPSPWEVAGTPVVPTVHPSFLLRSPDYKPKCWEDIKLAMKTIGLEPRRDARPRGDEGRA